MFWAGLGSTSYLTTLNKTVSTVKTYATVKTVTTVKSVTSVTKRVPIFSVPESKLGSLRNTNK